MGSRTTKEEIKEILELYNGGATIKEIAELTEKKYDTIWHLIRRNAQPKEPTPKKVSKEEKSTTFDARRSSPTIEENKKPINLHINRGEIYYIVKEPGRTPQEQEAGRPAIIVSNNKCNLFSDNVEVVFLTTQEKKDLPTHATIFSTGKKSIALCERIQTIPKYRIAEYVCMCTTEEIKAVNKALADSLGLALLEEVQPTQKTKEEENNANQVVIFERDTYKKLYEDLLEKVLSR